MDRLTNEQTLQGQGSNQRVYDLKPGEHLEDVYILLPRERDTIIAALRLWQDRDAFYSGGRVEACFELATNGNDDDYALDENEIDILIEDKINA